MDECCLWSPLFSTGIRLSRNSEGQVFSEAQAKAVVAVIQSAIIGNAAAKDQAGATRVDIEETGDDLRSFTRAVERRLLLRVGGIMAFAIGVKVAVDILW